jgi:hypothetical protein
VQVRPHPLPEHGQHHEDHADDEDATHLEPMAALDVVCVSPRPATIPEDEQSQEHLDDDESHAGGGKRQVELGIDGARRIGNGRGHRGRSETHEDDSEEGHRPNEQGE